MLEAQGILYLLQKKKKEMTTTTPSALLYQSTSQFHTGMGIEQSAVAASAWPQNLKIKKMISLYGSVNLA